MYFPIGWPKCVNLALPGESEAIKYLCFDAVKILLAGIGADFLGIWYANPLIPIVYHRRSVDSLMTYGTNKLVVWKPDSKKLVILTSSGALLLYEVGFDSDGNGIFLQIDPPATSLRRDSAELFIKENIPQLTLREVGTIQWEFIITTVCCISLSELLVANDKCELLRVQWSELSNLELNNSPRATIKLRNIPFYVSQQCSLKSVPAIAANAYIATLEYSPFIGGCAAVFSDKRAAFLIANHLRFETETMHGFWISDVEDATVCGVNHKFRLLAFGRHNSDVLVYGIEDTTGGIEFSHRLSLNSTTVPCSLGEVSELKWSPDGCVLVVAWSSGGIAMWSTFGALLMSSFNWDFGLHVDLVHNNPIRVSKLEWSTEGYQLFMTCQAKEPSARSVNESFTNVWQLNFVKSTLAMNPCMASHSHLLLQGDDTLYLNQGDNLEKIYFGGKFIFPNNQSELTTASQCRNASEDDCIEVKCSIDISSILAESKYWTIIQLPQTYAATNWPIRYSAIDADGIHVAVAGRTGLAHYSIITKKWKLFGNESQEKDFVVSGGLLWWKGFIVTGCYSLLDHTDEIRCYPEECKLDNQFGNRIQVRAPVISLNMFQNQLIALTADGIVSLFDMHRCDAYTLKAECAYEVDVKSICVHPACIVSLMVTNLRSDFTSKTESSSASSSTSSSAAVAETIIVNVCGRILMIHRDNSNAVLNSLMASCLASCVECFWLSNSSLENSPMRDCLWLFSGAHGMRVWLPILPPISNHEQRHSSSHRLHTFMSKRIMLSFPLKLYPLVILFDNVIVLGVDNETTLYMSETQSHFALPFSHLERKSQVYLHKILRQLIKRNLGYSAWEIAQSCRHLPYFPHSLELLLHEVLEEEATSKEPIPDALLPSVLDFIREFPVYLQTIVQCARKTEIALWPHLFSIAGKPKHLFQKCLETEELVTAASYLIILQNLEPSIVSKQYATLLLEVALKHHQWELARDLIRFLKAIDPNEIDSPRSSMVVNVKIAPQAQSQAQVNPNADAFDLILGPIVRERSFSTTVGLTANMNKSDKKEKALPPPVVNESTTVVVAAQHSSAAAGVGAAAAAVVRRKSVRNGCNVTALERRETFSIETILQRHARQLLQNYQLINLGYMSAFLDFHLVTWLSQEVNKTACLDDYVVALVTLHEELQLPKPVSPAQIRSNEEVDRDGEYAQLQRKYNIDQKVATLLPRTSSQTSESGYFSLALMDTPNSTAANNGNNVIHISSIKENEVMQYSTQHQQQHQQQQQLINNNSNISLDNSAVYERQRYCSMPDGDISASSLALAASNDSVDLPRILPEKLAIKMRYLLQLFIEANCVDFALVLSILLQDAASIGRIINVVIRSESLIVCERIQQRLKRVTEWTFEGNCTYRTFMTSLQPHIYLLDQYTMQSSESKAINSNRLSTADNGHHATNLNNLNNDSLNKLLPNNHNKHHNNKTSSSWSFDNYTEHEQHFNASNQNSTPNNRRYPLTAGRATSLDQGTTGRSNCHVM